MNDFFLSQILNHPPPQPGPGGGLLPPQTGGLGGVPPQGFAPCNIDTDFNIINSYEVDMRTAEPDSYALSYLF